MIKVLVGGFTAMCIFCAALLFGVALCAVLLPRVRDAYRRFRRRDKVASALVAAALAGLVWYGGAKQSAVNAGADEGIDLAEVVVSYDSTNDVTAVGVYFVGGNVNTDTPVSVRNAESENWQELVKQNAEVTTDLATNVLSFAVLGDVSTNRYWWIGVDKPAVIIESEGIKITRLVATSKRVEIQWTCDDPKATLFQIQRRPMGSSAQWETVGTTGLYGYVYEGFTVGRSWEWRVIATYSSEATP